MSDGVRPGAAGLGKAGGRAETEGKENGAGRPAETAGKENGAGWPGEEGLNIKSKRLKEERTGGQG